MQFRKGTTVHGIVFADMGCLCLAQHGPELLTQNVQVVSGRFGYFLTRIMGTRPRESKRCNHQRTLMLERLGPIIHSQKTNPGTSGVDSPDDFHIEFSPVFGLKNYLRTSRRYCAVRYKCRLLWFQYTLGSAPNNPYEW